MSKFQRKLAEKMGEKTMKVSVKEWDKLVSERDLLKDIVRELIEYDNNFPILNKSPFNKIINKFKAQLK